MTQGVTWSVFQFLAQVGVAVVALWAISTLTRSPKATIKTAAIFVAITTVLAVMLQFVSTMFAGMKLELLIGPIFLLVGLCIPVYLLMRLYEIRLLLAIGVYVALYVVNSVMSDFTAFSV